MGSGGRATLGDALSPAMKARLSKLREDLEHRARAAVEAQLKQRKVPWQRPETQLRASSPRVTRPPIPEAPPSRVVLAQRVRAAHSGRAVTDQRTAQALKGSPK